ncbi:hypothetical protein J6590_096917 [Homalodisca vitripennis]|nr:hypothetical protein J6590_096917 [Homalodisca vitripennis]
MSCPEVCPVCVILVTDADKGVVFEVNQRARRASNVMIYGLPESNSPDIKFRITHDLEIVTELLKSSHSTFSSEGVTTYRIGKKTNDKHRPLKVILKSEHYARLVLTNFSSEAAAKVNQIFSAVKIARDRTPQEQKYLKSVIAELEERTLLRMQKTSKAQRFPIIYFLLFSKCQRSEE